MVSSVPKNREMVCSKLLVQVLGTADEANRGKAKTVLVQRLVRSGDHFRVVSQAKVVIGAEIENFAAVLHLDFHALWVW